MVVGLLTIVYMLLGTFLIVTRYDQSEARSLATEAQNDPGASGIIGMIKQRLADDLHTDSSNPYAALTNDAQGWKGFIDYPSQDVDPFLASAYQDHLAEWTHLSDPLGLTGVDGVPIDTADDNYLDIDEDGYRDARRFDTGMMDPKGRTIHGFVRVLDTSAFVNLSIADGPDGIYGNGTVTANWTATSSAPYDWGDWKGADFSINPLATTPCDIDVTRMLEASVHGDFNYSRTGTASHISSNTYWHEFAQHPHYAGPYAFLGIPAPSYEYRPFGPGEEIFLRYSGPSSDTAGLLPLLIKDSDPADRIDRKRKLTTISVSRQLLRRPKTGSAVPDDDRTARVLLTRHFEPDDWLWQQLVAAGAAEKEAAHFLANLWAYTSQQDPRTEPFVYKPTRADGTQPSWRVYGAVEQLVVTDIFIYYEPPSALGQADEGWCVAIELMNPTSRSVDARDYEIGGFNFDNDAGNIPPGEKVILASVGGTVGKAGGAAGQAADYGYFQIPTTAGGMVAAVYTDVSELDTLALDAGASLDITRTVTQEGVDYDIPVDSASAADAGYNKPTDSIADGGSVTINGALRDDDWASYSPATGSYGGRQRALVARYKALNPNNATDHRIGKLNNASAIDSPDCYEGFLLHRLRGVPYNIGELAMVFTVGPDDDGNDLPHELVAHAKSDSRGRLDFRSSVGLTGTYPPVPWAAVVPELLAVLPGDKTRGPTDPTKGHVELRRVYGRVNINTAPREVLAALPWPDELFYGGTRYPLNAADRHKIAEYIQCYRDGQAVSGGPNYADRQTSTGIGSLRQGVSHNGFLTPGELAIPLSDYVNTLVNADDRKLASYASMFGRDALYRAVGNLVTVQSDTYVALVALQVQTLTGPKTWRYMALIDRSIVGKTGQQPAVLMFTKLE
jgi:hypothetical protein